MLAQTFTVISPTNASFGEKMTVAVTHFKSKGQSGLNCPTPETNPNCAQGDGQGFWNQRRAAAALALTDWLATDPTGSGEVNSMIIGDLNAYKLEDPIDALQQAGYTNLSPDNSTFVFDGQWGTLDYIFAAGALVDQKTGAAKWHINADEPDALDYSTRFNDPTLYAPDEFRASDHDPLIVGLNLGERGRQVLYLPAILKN